MVSCYALVKYSIQVNLVGDSGNFILVPLLIHW
jgi:hypothetical protein